MRNVDAHLRELRYFLAVAEELHFTRAAGRLFVSQPALSRQLRALERRLGFALFDRTPQGVLLTAAGAALLPSARAAVDAWEQGVARARAAGPSRVLVVGIATALGRDLQRVALRGLRARHPQWTVSLRMVGWQDPTAGLAGGESDVAFVWLPIPTEGLSVHPLLRERRFVALPAGHRLAGSDEVEFAELLDEPFIALPAQAGPLREYWLASTERGDVPAVIAAEASAPDEVFEGVASGIGVALLAEGNAALYPRPGVVCRPVTGLAPATLAVAWRTGDTREPVRDFVKAACASAETAQ